MYMTAESAQIKIIFSHSVDIINNVIQKTEKKKHGILNYLQKSGFQNNEIVLFDPTVSDRESYYTEEWENGKKVRVKADRFTYGQRIDIIIQDVEHAEKKS